MGGETTARKAQLGWRYLCKANQTLSRYEYQLSKQIKIKEGRDKEMDHQTGTKQGRTWEDGRGASMRRGAVFGVLTRELSFERSCWQKGACQTRGATLSAKHLLPCGPCGQKCCGRALDWAAEGP